MLVALALALPLLPCAALLPPPPARILRPATALGSSSRRGGGKKSGRRRRQRRRTRHRDEDDGYCSILDRDDIDHLGLAKSIDEEYAVEESKLGLTFWEVLERERKRRPEDISAKSREMSALARTKRRMTYSRGNVESKYTLMAPRNYGEPELLDRDHLENPPTLEDLNQTPPKFSESYWSRSIFRVGVVAVSYFAFPLFLRLFVKFQTVATEDFDIIVEQLAPNVGVLYATLLALTLQVLYQRLTRIEENVTTEAMLLSQVTRNLLSLFADEPEWAVEACQVVANQLRIMLSRTRGVELLSIMKADTYSNLLAIINDYHFLHGCNEDFTPREESVTGMIRAEIGQLMESRAYRLSDEASSLPPTHFLLVGSLSFVSIVAFVTASIKVVTDLSHPPQEASLLFSGLMALYILFFNFCRDLNGPFVGVYQIKRSNAASHLMQTKWLIKTQLGDAVDFSEDHSEGTAEAAGDLTSFIVGPETEDIAAVEATTMQTLVEELKTNVNEHSHGHPQAIITPLDQPEADGRERLQKMKDELAQLKQLEKQLTQDAAPLNRSDHEATLHQMMEDLARLKQLNQQLASTGESSHEMAGDVNPTIAQPHNDLSAAKMAASPDEIAPTETASAQVHGVHPVGPESKLHHEIALTETVSTQMHGVDPVGPGSKLHKMEEELARLKALQQQLTSTVHMEDEEAVRLADANRHRRP